MTLTQAPTIFESFNARSLNPVQVAQTFVAPPQYEQLAKHCHTILVGPRGSGKTTLLKMLQPPALETWRHPRAEEFRARIQFTGIFVATDRSWKAQLEALGQGRLDTATLRLLGNAAFTTHVLHSTVSAMLQRLNRHADDQRVAFRPVDLSDSDEANLVREIAATWHLRPSLPSFLALRHALTDRLSRIPQLADQEVGRDSATRAGRLAEVPFLHLQFQQATAAALEYFDDAVSEPDAKWALMFDELELAPPWIQSELLGLLRSTNAKLLLKLAMSPFTPTAEVMDAVTSPHQYQDFDQIRLWYEEKQDGYPFCEHLWNAMLQGHGLAAKEPLKVLGRSLFETSPEEWRGKKTAYGPDSPLANRFSRLATRDPSFRDYLAAKHIKPSELHLLSNDQRAADVRKVAPLIIVREFYRGIESESEKVSVRSRKTASLYAGAESLFAVSEGNPRWFIAIVGRLLSQWKNRNERIDRHLQGDEMLKAAERFAAMLRTIPGPSVGDSHRGLLTILNATGEFFHNQVVRERFRAEPPSTFIVDSFTSDAVLFALEQALNAGAIVYVPEGGQALLSSLRGKRFRVSYLLAPYYGLPIRLGKPVSLTSIIGKGASRGPTDRAQLPLLEGDSQ